MPSRHSWSTADSTSATATDTDTLVSWDTASTVTVTVTTTETAAETARDKPPLDAQSTQSASTIADAVRALEHRMFGTQAASDVCLCNTTGLADDSECLCHMKGLAAPERRAVDVKLESQAAGGGGQHADAKTADAVELFGRLLTYLRTQRYTPPSASELSRRAWTCVLACVLARRTADLKHALLRPGATQLADVAVFFKFTDLTDLPLLRPETPALASKPAQTGPPIVPADNGHSAVRGFLTDVVRTLCTRTPDGVDAVLWALRSSLDADLLRAVFTGAPPLADFFPLALLFHHPDEERTAVGLPRDFPLLFAYYARASWPPPVAETERHHGAPVCPILLSTFVDRLVAALRVDPQVALEPTPAELAALADLLPQPPPPSTPRAHPAIPYLCLATSLVEASERAAHMLLARGLARQLCALYDQDFRFALPSACSGSGSPPAVNSGALYRTLHLHTHALLRALAQHRGRDRAAGQYREEDRALGAVWDLKAEFDADVRAESRRVSERWHFWCARDEAEAERRDRAWLAEHSGYGDGEEFQGCDACRWVGERAEWTCPHVWDAARGEWV